MLLHAVGEQDVGQWLDAPYPAVNTGRPYCDHIVIPCPILQRCEPQKLNI